MVSGVRSMVKGVAGCKDMGRCAGCPVGYGAMDV